ncbi:MAG: NfeD family protein [Mediterranea sp.]|jgi:membrane-bound ClpP family serine protease|nr:NfeD family protein [Mediterranea sp.]
MDIVIIIILIVAAIVLFLVEVFLIPGISLAGIAAVAALVYANYYAFAYMGSTAGFITLIVSVAACVGSVILFMRSKMLDKISLKQNIDSKVDKEVEQSIRVGEKGVTTTRLALIGYAEIGGKFVEVKSTDGFLDEKTPVVVSRIADGMILVEEDK